MHRFPTTRLRDPRWWVHVVAAILAVSIAARATAADAPVAQKVVNIKVQIEGARDVAHLVRNADGSHEYLLFTLDGRTQRLTPEAFAARIYDEQSTRSLLSILFNISGGATALAWVCTGLLGQVLFAGRMIVQWFASEKSRRSVVPVSFWWMSLIGATMLLAYFLWRKDLVGVMGQSLGWVIYIRNLHLIHFGHRKPAAEIAEAGMET